MRLCNKKDPERTSCGRCADVCLTSADTTDVEAMGCGNRADVADVHPMLCAMRVPAPAHAHARKPLRVVTTSATSAWKTQSQPRQRLCSCGRASQRPLNVRSRSASEGVPMADSVPITDLLTDARALGMTVRADGERLVVRTPPSASHALAKALIARKAEVMAMLQVEQTAAKT